MTLLTRAAKGSWLTNGEADANIVETQNRLVALENVSGLVYTGAFAGIPGAATVPLGSVAIVTDTPAGQETIWRAGPTIWRPEGGEVILGQSGVAAAAVTGLVTAVTTDVVVIPGGMLGPNGQLIVEGEFSTTNNANNKTLQIRFESGPVRVFGVTIANTSSLTFRAVMTNRGSLNANRIAYNSTSGLGSAGTAENTALDTSVAQTLRCLIQLAVGTDSATLERWTVAVRPF
jgi:hypothetical protein